MRLDSEFRGHRYGQRYIRRFYEEVMDADSVTLAFNGAAYSATTGQGTIVPGGARVRDAFGYVRTAISGAGAATAILGDAVDPNRWQDAGALTVGITWNVPDAAAPSVGVAPMDGNPYTLRSTIVGGAPTAGQWLQTVVADILVAHDDN